MKTLIKGGTIVTATDKFVGDVLVDASDELHREGASEQVLTGIRQLRARIGALRPWSEVRALARDLAEKLANDLDVIASSDRGGLGVEEALQVSVTSGDHSIRVTVQASAGGGGCPGGRRSHRRQHRE